MALYRKRCRGLVKKSFIQWDKKKPSKGGGFQVETTLQGCKAEWAEGKFRLMRRVRVGLIEMGVIGDVAATNQMKVGDNLPSQVIAPTKLL